MTWERIGLNDAVDNPTDTTLGTYQKGTSQATATAAAPPSPPPPPLGNTMEHSRYLPTMEGRKTNSWSKLRGAVKATSVLSGASSKQNMQPSKVYASRGGAAASGGGGSLSSKEAATHSPKKSTWDNFTIRERGGLHYSPERDAAAIRVVSGEGERKEQMRAVAPQAVNLRTVVKASSVLSGVSGASSKNQRSPSQAVHVLSSQEQHERLQQMERVAQGKPQRRQGVHISEPPVVARAPLSSEAVVERALAVQDMARAFREDR